MDQNTIFSILIILFSIIIHEVSHGYAALFLGDETAKYEGRLTLNPLKHLDPIGSILVPVLTSLAGVPFGWAKPVPYNPYNLRNQRWGEAIVAFAGPLSNILVLGIFTLAIRIGTQTGMSESFVMFCGAVVLINLVLAIFNLVPIPPLDGSKLLFSILPAHMQNLRYTIERFGFVFVILFIIFLWKFFDSFILFIFSRITGFGF